jgi:hypothetical protein
VSLRLLAAAFLFLLVHATIFAQTIQRAYIGDDAKVRVVYANGDTKTIPPEAQQAGCEHLLIAKDGHTMGWSVLEENCCTSYPIATAIVVYRDGKKTYIPSPQMVYEWRFLGRGEQLAMLFGPVHGGASGANLYDARTGKRSASWSGKGATPEWAKDWKEDIFP